MTLDSIREWWPVINSASIALLALLSLGWRQIGTRIDRLTGSIEGLTANLGDSIKTLAVVQAQLQSHTEQDRASFHEIRNDMAARLLDVGKRLDAQRASIETLTLATIKSAQK